MKRNIKKLICMLMIVCVILITSACTSKEKVDNGSVNLFKTAISYEDCIFSPAKFDFRTTKLDDLMAYFEYSNTKAEIPYKTIGDYIYLPNPEKIIIDGLSSEITEWFTFYYEQLCAVTYIMESSIDTIESDNEILIKQAESFMPKNFIVKSNSNFSEEYNNFDYARDNPYSNLTWFCYHEDGSDIKVTYNKDTSTDIPFTAVNLPNIMVSLKIQYDF